jgi:hypothetical protein
MFISLFIVTKKKVHLEYNTKGLRYNLTHSPILIYLIVMIVSLVWLLSKTSQWVWQKSMRIYLYVLSIKYIAPVRVLSIYHFLIYRLQKKTNVYVSFNWQTFLVFFPPSFSIPLIEQGQNVKRVFDVILSSNSTCFSHQKKNPNVCLSLLIHLN